MSEELWGVFFKDSAEGEFLTEVYEDEEEAQEAASARDQRVFEQVMEEGEGDEPAWEDYDGMHYVERISSELATGARAELARGFVVRVG